jgi:hypothetical protein
MRYLLSNVNKPDSYISYRYKTTSGQMTSHAYSAGIARNVPLVSSYWKFPYDTVIKFYPTNFKLDSRPLYLTAYQQFTKYGNSDHIRKVFAPRAN